jgi:hypothetical protein
MAGDAGLGEAVSGTSAPILSIIGASVAERDQGNPTRARTLLRIRQGLPTTCNGLALNKITACGAAA